MHEYSVASSLLSFCDAELKKQNARGINVLYLRIGVMGGVDSYLLTEAFENLKQSTVHKDAVLDIKKENLTVQCNVCGAESAGDPVFSCPACGSGDVRLQGGNDLLIEKVEFVR